MDTDELARQARTLIDRDQKIEAIKLVRETTGWGLRESKDYVDALARAVLPTLGATGEAALEQEARALIQQDRYVEAIRRVRERTGWGLGEVKSYVDTLTGGGTVNWIFIVSNVRDLLAQGRRDEAVDWVVAQARVDVQEAREYVAFLDRSAQSPPDGWDLPAQVDSQIRDLLDQNRKVEAVMLVRILTNWGLRESKDYVDALGAKRGETHVRRADASGLAQFPPPFRIGRNDPCPCGSGRKYKHCCGKKR